MRTLLMMIIVICSLGVMGQNNHSDLFDMADRYFLDDSTMHLEYDPDELLGVGNIGPMEFIEFTDSPSPKELIIITVVGDTIYNFDNIMALVSKIDILEREIAVLKLEKLESFVFKIKADSTCRARWGFIAK